MILVTGGTGLVGAHLLLHLLQKGHKIRATHRKGSDLKRVQHVFSYYTGNASELFNKIDWVEADITDIPALEFAFIDIEYVYHCAALISFDPRDYYKLRNINTKGTANIVNLCLAKNIKKLGYISSIAALGKSEATVNVDEETEWSDAEVNVYALTKYAAEIEVWRGTQEGLDAVTINPGVILGSGFWHSGSGLFFKQVAKGLPMYPPGGTGFVSVQDVVKMITQLMESDIKNQRFIAVNKNLEHKEILSKIAKNLGKPSNKKTLKFWQLHAYSRFDFLIDFITRRGRKLTKKGVNALKRQEIYSNKKIKNTISFTFDDLDKEIAFISSKYQEEFP